MGIRKFEQLVVTSCVLKTFGETGRPKVTVFLLAVIVELVWKISVCLTV